MKRINFIKTVGVVTSLFLSGVSLAKSTPKSRFSEKQLMWLKAMHQQEVFDTVVTNEGIGFTCYSHLYPSLHHHITVREIGITAGEILKISTLCKFGPVEFMITEFQSPQEREFILTHIGYQEPTELTLAIKVKRMQLNQLLYSPDYTI